MKSFQFLEKFQTVGLSNIDIQKGHIDTAFFKECFGIINTSRRTAFVAIRGQNGIQPSANGLVIVDDENS